jgi:hypothetical protein
MYNDFMYVLNGKAACLHTEKGTSEGGVGTAGLDLELYL